VSSGRGGRAIAVLLGGPSAEHDVSLVSGRAIAGALSGRGHVVEGWLIDLDGGWWRLPPQAMKRELPQTAYDDPASLDAEGPLTAALALERLAGSDPRPVIFPALHGSFGEDGTLQALLESTGLAYCGCGPAASAIGMDKAIFKRLCGALEVPVVAWLEVRAGEFVPADRAATLARVEAFAAGLPDPRLVIKPARLGSSIGVGIVRCPGVPPELEHAMADAFQYDDLLLVEAYVADARELEASVVGNEPAEIEVFGPGEIIPGREFYDFVAKYRSDDSRTLTQPNPPLDPELRERARRAAREVYLAIGAAGFARVDFLLAGDGSLYVSEINTIPGFTPISLFPVLCAEGGYSFEAICEHIVDLAILRSEGRPTRHLTRADLP
jgi:D-alanine-D-alanine ligase